MDFFELVRKSWQQFLEHKCINHEEFNVLFYTGCGGCLVWWLFGVVDVWCGGGPILHVVWWMSFLTHGVVDVWCGEYLVWCMSGVVDVRCGGYPILHMVWWMSGVVDVCVVDVVQST